MAHYKLNTLVLYLQDAFVYPSHPETAELRDRLTAADVEEMVSFARGHHLDVPQVERVPAGLCGGGSAPPGSDARSFVSSHAMDGGGKETAQVSVELLQQRIRFRVRDVEHPAEGRCLALAEV
jgi:hypothetical protein